MSTRLITKDGQVSASGFDRVRVTANLFFFLFAVAWQKHGTRHILARAQTVCGWTRCVARAMSSLWSSAPKVPGGNTTVCIQRTQECPAAHSQVEHNSFSVCNLQYSHRQSICCDLTFTLFCMTLSCTLFYRLLLISILYI